jgi:hypothetical protein
VERLFSISSCKNPLTSYTVDFALFPIAPSIGEVYYLEVSGQQPECYTIQRATQAASDLLLSASSVYNSCEECQSHNP